MPDKEIMDIEEIKMSLKKLSAILLIDGIRTDDIQKLTLGNSLGISVAMMDLGSDACLTLTRTINPLGELIQKEIASKNPLLKGVAAVRTDDLFKDGKIDRDYVDTVLASSVDISEALKGTGATPAPDESL